MKFRRLPILCTTLYRNPMQVSNVGGTFDQLFLSLFYEIFTEDASLLLIYHGAKKSNMTTNSNQGGSCLKGVKRPDTGDVLACRISFTNRTPFLWNMLPREVQVSSSMSALREKSFHSLTLELLSQARTAFADLFWKHCHRITLLLFFLFFSSLSRRTSLRIPCCLLGFLP